MQIIERIAEKLLKDNLSVLRLSNETGISAYKIYKWLSKKGNPKHEDSIKLEQWLSGDIEKVPNSPDIIATDGKQTYVFETKSLPTNSDYIQLLQRHIEATQKSNELLLRILDEKITAMETNLNEMRSNQLGIFSLLREAATQAAMYRYGKDKKKLDSELHEINKIVGAVLK